MVNSRYKDKVNYMCRACNTERHRKYRSTPEGKKKVFDAVYRSTQKHMHKQLARMKFNYELQKGKIKKPEVCTHCKESLKLEAHHEDYTKPLDVLWLCRPCHALVHKQKKVFYN